MSNITKIYCNINNNNQLYNEIGELYGQNDLALFFNNTSVVEMHYVTETTSSSNPQEWQQWTSLKGTAISSSAAFNDTRQHAYRGFVTKQVDEGSEQITLRMESDSVEINYSDILVIRNLNGTTDTFIYKSYEIDPEDSQLYTFTLNSKIDSPIAQNTLIRVRQALLFAVYTNSVDTERKDEGIFTFNIHVTSNRLHDLLDYSDTEVLTGTFEHKIYSDGSTIQVFQFPMSVYNLLDYDEDTEIPTPSIDDVWATKAYVLSFVNEGLKFQFSNNGTNWADEQKDTDLYFRVKSGMTGADVYSNAIKIPKGADGAKGDSGASAGFGDIEAVAETIGSNEDASVSVDTSGTDSKKNIKFNFKIPKGSIGVNGTDGKDGASFKYRGTYSDLATYSYLDTVLYGNSLYLCISYSPILGQPPASRYGSTSNYWTILTTAVNSTEIYNPSIKEQYATNTYFGTVPILWTGTNHQSITYVNSVYRASTLRLYIAPVVTPPKQEDDAQTPYYIALKIQGQKFGESTFTTLNVISVEVPSSPSEVKSVVIDLYALNGNDYFSGILQIVRDVSNSHDTLADAKGDKIQCALLSSTIKVMYETNDINNMFGDLYYTVIQGA